MKQVEERYISLLTDFGFKRIFGTAMNKDLLICFLNSLFNGRQVVKDVSYLNPEHVGDVYSDRRAIFDVYCEGENGEKFIVEMQNAYQTYFKDRALFYSTFPIREQAPKGNDWDFKLNHVYTVALLNFNMYEDAFDKEKTRHHVQLCNTATHKISYDKQEFIYVVLAKFNKTLGELETLYEKWLYALKNLYKLTQRPKELCDKVFDRLFEEAEIAKFTPQEMREYEASKMIEYLLLCRKRQSFQYFHILQNINPFFKTCLAFFLTLIKERKRKIDETKLVRKYRVTRLLPQSNVCPKLCHLMLLWHKIHDANHINRYKLV